MIRDDRPRVLFAGERFGHGRDAFIRAGCVAFSCDLKASATPGPHFVDDWDNVIPRAIPWDLIVIHPVCTKLTVSGNHVYAAGKPRHQERLDAAAYTERLWKLVKRHSRHACLENPRGVLATLTDMGKASQSVQPHDFGHDASKTTDFWLHELPPLVATSRVAGRLVEYPPGSGKTVERWANQTDSGQNRLGPTKDPEDRQMARAESYTGILDAMADQWAHLLRAA